MPEKAKEPQPFQALYGDVLMQFERLKNAIEDLRMVRTQDQNGRYLYSFTCSNPEAMWKKLQAHNPLLTVGFSFPGNSGQYLNFIASQKKEAKEWFGVSDEMLGSTKSNLKNQPANSIPEDDEFIKMNKEAMDALGVWARRPANRFYRQKIYKLSEMWVGWIFNETFEEHENVMQKTAIYLSKEAILNRYGAGNLVAITNADATEFYEGEGLDNV